ncbi:MAG: bifunctional DNA-formamidopyrimidine glycosylase/DNA-(apurinic or apyrimidinic site) lyase, partial [Bacillota bacterium]
AGPAWGELVLHVHLGMTGRLVFLPPGDPAPDRHVHARFSFDRGELYYQDTRRFGYLELLPGSALGDHPRLRLGPEPLDGSFTTEVLRGMLAGRRAPVKAVLLDQHIMAGIGNIYADEALHRAGVHPLRPAGDLGEREVETLRDALREVLEEAIAARGTTFSDYRDGEGRPGEFVSRLCVYGREGEACPRCGTPVARQRLGGRSTYFCPCCQK